MCVFGCVCVSVCGEGGVCVCVRENVSVLKSV